jgi:hypothetical protein
VVGSRDAAVRPRAFERASTPARRTAVRASRRRASPLDHWRRTSAELARRVEAGAPGAAPASATKASSSPDTWRTVRMLAGGSRPTVVPRGTFAAVALSLARRQVPRGTARASRLLKPRSHLTIRGPEAPVCLDLGTPCFGVDRAGPARAGNEPRHADFKSDAYPLPWRRPRHRSNRSRATLGLRMEPEVGQSISSSASGPVREAGGS